MKAPFILFIVAGLLALASGCDDAEFDSTPTPMPTVKAAVQSPAVEKMLASCAGQTKLTKKRATGEEKIAYPGGDVPLETGVAADVAIRAFRAAGVDLQKEVHEDMVKNFALYPNLWKMTEPDTNVDHRRVPNLMNFFMRQGKTAPSFHGVSDFLPGDVVTWRLPGEQAHIGIVSDHLTQAGGTPLVYHNNGFGTRLEDVLFTWRITGHFRYFPVPIPPNL